MAIVVLHDAVPGEALARYPVIAEPPSDVGAAQETVARPFPATAVTFVGALGAPIGVTAVDAALEAELPALFDATTVNVYAVPLVRPVQLAVTPATAHVPPAGEGVTS